MAGGVLVAYPLVAPNAKGGSPAFDIAELVESYSIGTVGETIFKGREPDQKPDEPILCFYDTGGFDPVVSKESKDYQPTIQVISVGVPQDPEPAYDLINSVKALIQGEVNLNTFFTANDLTYYGIFLQGDINFIGTDENDRARYSLNLRAYRTEDQGG